MLFVTQYRLPSLSIEMRRNTSLPGFLLGGLTLPRGNTKSIGFPWVIAWRIKKIALFGPPVAFGYSAIVQTNLLRNISH